MFRSDKGKEPEGYMLILGSMSSAYGLPKRHD